MRWHRKAISCLFLYKYKISNISGYKVNMYRMLFLEELFQKVYNKAKINENKHANNKKLELKCYVHACIHITRKTQNQVECRLLSQFPFFLSCLVSLHSASAA